MNNLDAMTITDRLIAAEELKLGRPLTDSERYAVREGVDARCTRAAVREDVIKSK